MPKDQFARLRRFLALYLPLLLLVGSLTAYLGVQQGQARQDMFESDKVGQLHSSTRMMLHDLEQPKEHLQGLVQEPALQRAFAESPHLGRALMEEVLQSLLHRNPLYLRASWVGADGLERARVERLSASPAPLVASDVQYVGDSSHFNAAIRLLPGQVYFSALDLNAEYGQIEEPKRPVLRAAIRLPTVRGMDQGLLLLNVSGQRLLDDYVANSSPDHGEERMLLDSQGHWLLAPDPQDDWGHLRGREGDTLARRQPQAWQQIAATPSGLWHDASGLWIWNSVEPDRLWPDQVQAAESWKLVSHLGRDRLHQLWWQGWPLLLLNAVIILLLLGFCLRRYSRLLHTHETAAQELASAYQLRQSQAELQHSHELLSLAEQGADAGFWDWDMELGPEHLHWSPQTFRLFGLDPTTATASFDSWRRALHPDDLPAAEASIADALRERKPFVASYRVVLPDGTLRWLDAYGQASYDESGSPTHFSGLCLDVTARKQAEEALIELNADLERKVQERTAEIQLLAENASDVVFRVNSSQIEWVSPSVAAQVGWTAEQLTGRSWIEFVHEDDRAATKAALQALRQGERATFVIRILTRDGGSHWVSVAIRAIFDQAGAPVAYVGGWRDIQTEVEARLQLSESRQQLEHALADVTASEARLHAIFDQAPIGIALTDAHNGQIHDCNERYAAISGRSVEQMRHADWMSITHPDDIPADQEQMARLNAGEIPGFQMKKRYLRPDGSVVWVRLTVGRLQGDSFETPRHLCMVEDITEQRQTEQDLLQAKDAAEQASRAKSAFVANMSHEVRTPMNAVLGFLDILADSGLDGQQRTLVHKVQKSSRALLRILNDILDFSKLDAGAVDLEMESFELDEVLRDATDLLALTASSKGLELVLDLPPGLPQHYRGDALRLGQILVNLLGNAIKFTERGSVLLTVRPLDKAQGRVGLRFEVTDTGIGLTPEQMERLFQPFVQADSTTTRRFGGTGLGLTISRRLVELMGGEIGIRSGPGQGATFWFTVRLVVEQPGEPGTVAQLRQGQALLADSHDGGRQIQDRMRRAELIRGARLLLVEDNRTNQEIARSVLGKMGLQVKVANHGREALDLLACERFDLVLMDLQMPVMGGLEATSAIRATNWGRDLPIIAMTAAAFADDRQRVLEAGMNDYVSKPVDARQLLDVLLRWLPHQLPPPADEATAAACAPVAPQEQLQVQDWKPG